MQRPKIVEDYLNAVVPKNIADSTRAEILAEIECHIYDKAEFYIEIGYDEETAFQRAVEEMGESEDVKREFNSIYKDSAIKGILLFLVICTLNILNVSPFLHIGYNFLDHSSYCGPPNLIQITLLLIGLVFLTVHTIKCYREKLHKQLTGIVSAFALISLGSFIINGISIPILIAGEYVCCYLLSLPLPNSLVPAYIVNIIVIAVYTFILFLSLVTDSRFKPKPYRLSLKQITIILSVINVCFIIVYSFAYAKYQYPHMYNKDNMTEISIESYLSTAVKEQRDSYLEIKTGYDIKNVERKLIERGFVEKTQNYEDFVYDAVPYDYKAYLLEDRSNNIDKDRYSMYCYVNTMDEKSSSDDIISSIIVSYNKENKINYKIFIPDASNVILVESSTLGEETEKWFNNLKIGDDCEAAMEFIRKTDSYIMEEEKLSGNDTEKTYRINLWCHYPLAVTFVDIIFGRYPIYVEHKFYFEIKSTNGLITEFKSFDYHR